MQSDRPLLCEVHSPDGHWFIQVFGHSKCHNGHYAHANRNDRNGYWSFGVGRELVGIDRFDFRCGLAEWFLGHFYRR